MDVRQYFKKLREFEAAIPEPFVFVTSLENSDGGKPGVVSEVARELAAKLLVEQRAILSSEIETQQFLARHAAQKLALEKAEMASRVQVTIVSDSATGVLSEPKAGSHNSSKK